MPCTFEGSLTSSIFQAHGGSTLQANYLNLANPKVHSEVINLSTTYDLNASLTSSIALSTVVKGPSVIRTNGTYGLEATLGSPEYLEACLMKFPLT